MRNGFAPFARRRPAAARDTRDSRQPSETDRLPVPAGFDAVAEALVAGTSPVAACAVAGRALAGDGLSLGEIFAGLRATCAAVGTAEPDLAAAEALSVAWSEATLEFLHEVSCEDPLTGLASLPHLRTRLAEVYREAERTARPVHVSHALLVVDVGGSTGGDAPTDTFSRALRLAAVSDALRTVFSGEETIARVAPHRVAALVRRTSQLGDALAVTRGLLADLDVADPRVWVEGLPMDASLGVRTLSELAR